MGKSIRSKVKQKWRSEQRRLCEPFEEKKAQDIHDKVQSIIDGPKLEVVNRPPRDRKVKARVIIEDESETIEAEKDDVMEVESPKKKSIGKLSSAISKTTSAKKSKKPSSKTK
eukprot:TRINITY_DN924_c0_g1_i1.p1 TRINITY_DN924_c0_g1~~TRINITY_DN924_c0_g1_i1.p1  ORF type:complete len:113 (+),score=32.90 TRINITY_DN924_c0_g1_i1:84-422(+)